MAGKAPASLGLSNCVINWKVLERTSHLRVSQRHTHLTLGTCPFACLSLSLPYPTFRYHQSADIHWPYACPLSVHLRPSFLPLFPWCTSHSTYALLSSWTDYFLLPYHHHPCVCPRGFPPSTDHCCCSSQLIPVSVLCIDSWHSPLCFRRSL